MLLYYQYVDDDESASVGDESTTITVVDAVVTAPSAAVLSLHCKFHCWHWNSRYSCCFYCWFWFCNVVARAQDPISRCSQLSDKVNVYSFSLKPEEHQPSGTCNFSRIDNAK